MPKVPTAPGQEVFPGAVTTLLSSNQAAFRIGRQIESGAGDIADIMLRRQAIRDRAASIRALNTLRIQSNELKQALLSDPDTENRAQKYGESMQQVTRGLAEGMSRQAQDSFLPQADTLATTGYLEVEAQSFQDEIADIRAAAREQQDIEIRRAAEAASDGESLAILDDLRADLIELAESHVITDDVRVELERQARRSVAVGRARNAIRTSPETAEGYIDSSPIMDALAPEQKEQLLVNAMNAASAAESADLAAQDARAKEIERLTEQARDELMKQFADIKADGGSAVQIEMQLMADTIPLQLSNGEIVVLTARDVFTPSQYQDVRKWLISPEPLASRPEVKEAALKIMTNGGDALDFLIHSRANGDLLTEDYNSLVGMNSTYNSAPGTVTAFEQGSAIIESAMNEAGLAYKMVGIPGNLEKTAIFSSMMTEYHLWHTDNPQADVGRHIAKATDILARSGNETVLSHVRMALGEPYMQAQISPRDITVESLRESARRIAVSTSLGRSERIREQAIVVAWYDLIANGMMNPSEERAIAPSTLQTILGGRSQQNVEPPATPAPSLSTEDQMP